MEVKYSDRFCANLWSDKAMTWMDEQIEAKRPFFAYIALNTPHSPFHSLRKDFTKYKDRVDDPLVAHFFGLISNIDQNCARLDHWLTEKKIRENTLIVQFGSRHRPSKYYRSCVVWDHWRLNGAGELYDIRQDPGQENDVSSHYPQITAELKNYYDNYWASIEESSEVRTSADIPERSRRLGGCRVRSVVRYPG